MSGFGAHGLDFWGLGLECRFRVSGCLGSRVDSQKGKEVER